MLMRRSPGQQKVSEELAEAAVENLKAGRYFEYVPGKNNDRQGDFTIKLHCQSIKQLWMEKVSKNNKTWPDSAPTTAKLLRMMMNQKM